MTRWVQGGWAPNRLSSAPLGRALTVGGHPILESPDPQSSKSFPRGGMKVPQSSREPAGHTETTQAQGPPSRERLHTSASSRKRHPQRVSKTGGRAINPRRASCVRTRCRRKWRLGRALSRREGTHLLLREAPTFLSSLCFRPSNVFTAVHPTHLGSPIRSCCFLKAPPPRHRRPFSPPPGRAAPSSSALCDESVPSPPPAPPNPRPR